MCLHANLFYSGPSMATTLGLTGTFGVSLYTKTVVSGGDSWGRRNRTGAGPDTNYEALSDGVEGGTRSCRRAGSSAFASGIGSGPDGNSLTADYQRSPGSGAEAVSGQPTLGEVGNLSGLAPFSEFPRRLSKPLKDGKRESSTVGAAA